MKPFLSGRAVIPLNLLTKEQIAYAVKKLVFTSVKMDEISKHIKFDNTENEIYEDQDEDIAEETVNECVIHEVGRVLSVPREWARQAWPHLDFRDKTVFPSTEKFHHEIKARDTNQKKYFEALLAEAQKPGPRDILANATTGAGKSVAAVWLALELATPTLILVDSNKLKNQYIKLIETLMGIEWRQHHVGIVQQDTCDFENKAIVIGMVQSISRRKYPKAFYIHFGFVDFDEVQIFGTKVYSICLGLFPARVRIGLTATNKQGEFGQLIKSHLGMTKFVSRQEVMKPVIYVLRNAIDHVFPCDSDGAILTSLSRLHDRNDKLAKIITDGGYKRGRNVLALSNRIAQLQSIRDLLIARGVPEEAIGLHVGYYYTDRYQLFYQYGENGKRQRIDTYDTYARARGACNRLQQGKYAELHNKLRSDHPLLKALNKNQSVIFSVEKELYTPTQNELDNITNSCQIVLATYEIFSKGVDVPRLDFGVECLPVGKVTQPLGRILRIMDGKETPEWVSISDYISLDNPEPRTVVVANALNNFFTAKANMRMQGFKKAKASIKVAST